MIYVRFPLSLRNVEDMLHERGTDICHESARLWIDRFGTCFAHKIRKRRSESMRRSPQWQWHLDEVFVSRRQASPTSEASGTTVRQAVDHEGEVLESYVTKIRDNAAALKFLRKATKRYGNPEVVVTGRRPACRAAMKITRNERRQEAGRYLNNRTENSLLPFRRRERAMPCFRRMRNLQKSIPVHSSVYNHFNLERHINSWIRFKQKRDVALRQWRDLLVVWRPLVREYWRLVRIRLTAPIHPPEAATGASV